MAVIHLGNQRYEGLTADTKPTNAPTGALYRDTQLDIIYEYNGASWDIIFGNTKTETLTGKTIGTGGLTITAATAASIATPSAGFVILFFDSDTSKLSIKDSTDTTTALH